ncbi:MAG: cache domain-containing protein [Deltaproteobacteria bacterium]|nr:cache domain-containing protein [Deltaproteobacteria bacterium]
MLAHPDPRLEGKDLSDLRDPNGVYIVRELTRVARESGAGFVEYQWKQPGAERLQPKLSYAKLIGKNWVLNTGIYLDDLDGLVAGERRTIERDAAAMIRQNVEISLVALIALAGLATWLLHRFLSRPLALISSGIESFENDLSRRLPLVAKDELGDVALWFNRHVEQLNGVIGMVAAVTADVNGHAASLAATVESQAGFSTELSSSVVEISSTMDEFSSTARQIASHSQGVVEIAERTLQATIDGATEVENLTAKMNEIERDNEANIREIVELGRKSKEITKIMEIINNIAAQTKLIAFNAALEAASAGETGKRFGVVAVEIRRLADSVVESTSEIEGKITEITDAVSRLVVGSEKSSKGVVEGLASSTQTANVLSEVVRQAEEATEAAKQISLSTQQQQTASGQVVAALREIEGGTRHSAEAIRRASEVSSDLACLAGKLTELVARFRLADEGEAHARG